MYKLKGNTENPGIVFLHGFMGCSASWDEVTELLKEDYCCMTLDLPYHGLSSDLELDWDQTVVALQEQIREVCQQPVHLVGYSLGARLALQLILKYPELFLSASLESVTPGVSTEKERRERQDIESAWAEHMRDDFIGFVDAWLRQDMFIGLKRLKNFYAIRRRYLANNPLALEKSLKTLGVGKMPSLWDAMKMLKVPTQLIVGQKDTHFIRTALSMRQVQPLLGLEITPGVGHNVHEEKAQLYVKSLNTFIGSLEVLV